MLRACFSTLSCPDWSFQQIVQHGREFGFDGVEIRLIERETDLLKLPEFQPAERPRRRRELADSGFEVPVLASNVRFHDLEASVRKEQVETGKAYLDLAKELGASFGRVFGDVVGKNNNGQYRPAIIQQVAEGLQRLGEYAETLELNIVIETHGDYSDSRLMQQTMALVETPAVGVLWDTHHPWRFCGESLSETSERLKAWVRHTHWKDSVLQPREQTGGDGQDAADQAHELMQGHRHADYVLLGSGEFPALQCMRLLRQSGYDGWVSLEWEKMWHPEIAGPEIALPPFPGKIRQLWELASRVGDATDRGDA